MKNNKLLYVLVLINFYKNKYFIKLHKIGDHSFEIYIKYKKI